MTDQVAIVTKAKENVIFAMAEQLDEIRAMLSIRKHELIQKVSSQFNYSSLLFLAIVLGKKC